MADDINNGEWEPDAQRKLLQIEKLKGSYSKTLGILKSDVIVGVNGKPFAGSKQDFMAFFMEDDEENPEEEDSEIRVVLTLARGETFFNVVASELVRADFKEIGDIYSPLQEELDVLLNEAKSENLSEYLIFHDNFKNAELLLKSNSLLAMMAPPYWLLNQRVPEAAAATILAGGAAFAVHWVLGAIYYVLLCWYIGREQFQLSMTFMSYRRKIYLQTIASVSELKAQAKALDLEKELFFQSPAEGLVQRKRKRKRKALQQKVAYEPAQ